MAIEATTLCKSCPHPLMDHGAHSPLAESSSACQICACPRFGVFGVSADPVNHPPHYGGDVPHEVIKCLAAWGLERDALLWNTVKYIARSGLKGAPLVDLKKAAFYLQRRIQEMEEKEGAGA